MIRKEKRDAKRATGTVRTIGLLIAALTMGVSLLCSPLPSQAQQVVEPQASSESSPRTGQVTASKVSVPISGYAIAPGDLLDVYVVGVPELSRTYRVDPFGKLTLPMLNRPITAEGLSPDELSNTISKALRQERVISRPDVLVSVRSTTRNSVVVTGSVARPGIYPVFGQTTLVDVLFQAGGLSDDAGSTAIVTRGAKAMSLLGAESVQGRRTASAGGQRVIKVEVRHLLETGDQAQDVTLYPGDNVEVPRAGIIYVVGAVNRAGGYALTSGRNQLTVLEAVALAGNVTRTAITKRTVIIRSEPKDPSAHEQIKVNLKKILSGKSPDRTLMAGDILFVPDSTSKRVIGRALSAVMTAAIFRVPF